MAKDFLFELGCEELPSKAVPALAEALKNEVITTLDKLTIRYAEARYFATPRRLTLLLKNLQEEQPPQVVSRRGPALAAAYDAQGEPTPALSGFAKSCGVTVNELTRSKTDKGEWMIYESTTPGTQTSTLLPTIINQALTTLPIAKPMRWGSGDVEFARPVHWALMLFGQEIINCEILGIQTGTHSYGHRFHHSQAIQITAPEDYENLLEQAYVIADFNKRRELIRQQVETLAAQQDAIAIMPDSLLDEVTAIVEWPQALEAQFADDFLAVPAEALIASMQTHQKCFALQSKHGQLLARFITVSNIASTNPTQVILGNEKVMRARLSDAAFFFRHDQEQSLVSRLDATKSVLFQAKLGSLHDKTQRLIELCTHLVDPLQLSEEEIKRAALLSQCDLLTGMVGEFPELQGIMGYYYARHDGETEGVATALKEQYLPRFAGDVLPQTKLGLALSLVDRVDTLVGIFAIGQKPTGVKDPFKLRRHALAIVRLLQLIPSEISLTNVLEASMKIYKSQLSIDASDCLAEIQSFILERLQSFYQSQGVRTDLVQAVRARQANWLYDFARRIQALAAFVHQPEASVLSAACKRVNNLLQQVDVSSLLPATIDETLLEEGAEKALFNHLQTVENGVQAFYREGDYANILSQLAGLREPVDAFFTQVMVMVDNPPVKKNRLSVLMRLQNLLQGVADISLLQLEQL